MQFLRSTASEKMDPHMTQALATVRGAGLQTAMRFHKDPGVEHAQKLQLYYKHV